MGCTHTYVCCSRNSGTYRESRLATALFPAASLTGYEQIEFFVNDDTTYRGVSSDGPIVTHDVFGDDAPRARPIPHYQVFDGTVLLLAPDAPITRRHLRLITRVGASRTGKRAVIHRGQQ